MKTHKHLFDKIVAFENLLAAANKAALGKREKPYVIEFFAKLEENLFRLQSELEHKTYYPGRYSTFQIYEPKPRMISAAPFRDRIVHHALINIIGTGLERSFIFDTYSNRLGKGTHKAIRRYQTFLRRNSYVLKCDIKKYFPSIDHAILKCLLKKRISCEATLWLINKIIDFSNPQDPVDDYFPGDTLFTPQDRRKGLPIGNLTSQFFANLYLNQLDHFVKEELRCRAYVRYVDDFVLFGDSKQCLREWRDSIAIFLSEYRLKLHPTRCQIYPAPVGGRFLGQVIWRTHRLLPGQNVHRFKSRVQSWRTNPPENIDQRLASWVGHASQANTFCLLKAQGLSLKSIE